MHHHGSITIAQLLLLLLLVELELLDIAPGGNGVGALGSSEAASTTANLVARDFKDLLIALVKMQVHVAGCIGSRVREL